MIEQPRRGHTKNTVWGNPPNGLPERMPLVPYAGLNLIRFNGIRNYPISASDSRHPDKNPASLLTAANDGNVDTTRRSDSDVYMTGATRLDHPDYRA